MVLMHTVYFLFIIHDHNPGHGLCGSWAYAGNNRCKTVEFTLDGASVHHKALHVFTDYISDSYTSVMNCEMHYSILLDPTKLF